MCRTRNILCLQVEVQASHVRARASFTETSDFKICRWISQLPPRQRRHDGQSACVEALQLGVAAVQAVAAVTDGEDSDV